MECILMNKNTKIAKVEYNSVFDGIERICEEYNMEYAPLPVTNCSVSQQNPSKALRKWFARRGIPTWRDKLDETLQSLGIDVPQELLNKAFGLSLSDQYWLKPVGSDITWEQVNFFTNDFDSADFAEASFGSIKDSSDINFFTPNNTTDGMLRKAWVIENNERILLKGGYKRSLQEPFNEWLAAQICSALGFSHVGYTIKMHNNTLVSCCKCFVTPDTEFIPALAVYESEKKPNHVSEYEFYISILEKHGIANARSEMENMLVLDYVIMNVDRHTRNFGVIRNVNTLEWETVSPIFDSGQAMCSQSEMNFNTGYGKLFSNTNCEFGKILDLVSEWRRFDFSALHAIVGKWKDMLRYWQHVSGMSDEHIEKLVFGLRHRIDMICKIQKEGII